MAENESLHVYCAFASWIGLWLWFIATLLFFSFFYWFYPYIKQEKNLNIWIRITKATISTDLIMMYMNLIDYKNPKDQWRFFLTNNINKNISNTDYHRIMTKNGLFNNNNNLLTLFDKKRDTKSDNITIKTESYYKFYGLYNHIVKTKKTI